MKISRRVVAVSTLVALSAITGVVSYEHGLDVVRAVGNTGIVAYAVPIVPDLSIVAASMTLLEASALGRKRPLAAMAALVVSIGWTIAANVVAGTHGGPGGALIAAGIPVVFLLTLEALLWLVRNSRPAVSEDVPADAPVTVPEHVTEGVPEPVIEEHPETVLEPSPESAPAVTPESAPAPRAPRARKSMPKRTRSKDPKVVYAAELESGNLPSVRQIKADLHLGQEKAKDVRRALEIHRMEATGESEAQRRVRTFSAQPELSVVGEA